MSNTTDNSETATEPQTAPPTAPQWMRAKDGMIGGVCKALARQLQIDPWIIRIVWLISACYFGTGLLLYLILVICLPREDDPSRGYKPKLLGVCSRVAKRVNLAPGLVRLIAVFLVFVSFGSALIAYVALAVLLPKD